MKYSNEIKIGLTIVIAIFIGVIGFRAMRDMPVFQRGRDVVAVFERVDGLATGKKVLYNGVDIGSVNTITLLPNDSVEVRMKIRSEAPIPVDSKAILQSMDLLGTKAIVIEKGSSPESIVLEGRLLGVYDAGAMSELTEKGADISNEIIEAGGSVNDVLAKVNELLAADELRKTINNVESATRSADALLKENQANIDASIKNLNSLLATADTSAKELKPEIEKALASLTETSTKYQELSMSLKAVSDELTFTLKGMNEGKGTLGKLLNDPSLYHQVDSLTYQLNVLLRNIDKDPKKYLKHVKISLF